MATSYMLVTTIFIKEWDAAIWLKPVIRDQRWKVENCLDLLESRIETGGKTDGKRFVRFKYDSESSVFGKFFAGKGFEEIFIPVDILQEAIIISGISEVPEERLKDE